MIAIALLVLLLPLTSYAAPTETWSPATDCRANIRKATCRVASQPDAQRGDPRFNRACLGGEATYAAELLKVHDELPPKLQKMFCHLRKIYIEEDMPVAMRSGRYPQIFVDKKGQEMVGMNGNSLSLSRKMIFESQGTLTQWLSRRDQSVFAATAGAPISPGLPQMDIKFTGSKANPVVLYSVLHEFGKLFETSHRLNPFRCAEDAEGCKRIFKSLWNSVSWTTDGKILPEQSYAGGFIPCYEDCSADKLGRIEDAASVYKTFLEKNSFVSLLASSNSSEDFAETFFFYMAGKYLSSSEDPDQKYFSASLEINDDMVSMRKRVRLGALAMKMEYMAMFDNMTWAYEPSNSAITPLNEYIELLATFRAKHAPTNAPAKK